VERNAAVIDVGQTGGNAQQRALAAATGPQEHEEFARFDLQRNVVDRRYAIATLGNLLKVDRHTCFRGADRMQDRVTRSVRSR
jgi:hypothetical protein